MATKKFIQFYENSECTFDFNNFFQNVFEHQSPVRSNKQKVECNIPINVILQNLCDSVLGNLFQNDSFKSMVKIQVPLPYLQPFYKLVKTVYESDRNYNDDIMPKLILYLHMSKCKFDNFRFMDFFLRIDSVRICSQLDKNYFWFVSELESLYLKVVNNNQIRETAMDVVKKITRLLTVTYDFKALQLKFFSTTIGGLNGFAGINTIYVSINSLHGFYQQLNVKLDKDNSFIILKLNFLRLVLHEMAHVILRNFLNDVNVSTPDELKKSKLKEPVSESQNMVEEAGIMAEIHFFGARINWCESIKNSEFNIQYCADFLKRFEENQKVKFDIDVAKIEKCRDEPSLMAIDESKFHGFEFE